MLGAGEHCVADALRAQGRFNVGLEGLAAFEAGQKVGKAVDEASFYEVLDKIKQHEAFFNVQMIHLRNVGRDLSEKEFAVNFEFRGMK